MSVPQERVRTATFRQIPLSSPPNSLTLEQEILQHFPKLQRVAKTNPSCAWLKKYKTEELLRSERIRTRRIAAMAIYLYKKRIPLDFDTDITHVITPLTQDLSSDVLEKYVSVIEQLHPTDGSLVFFEKHKFTPMINSADEMEDAAVKFDFRYVPDPKDYVTFLYRKKLLKEKRVGFFLARQKEATSPIARIQSAGWGGWHQKGNHQAKDPKAPSAIFLFSHPHDRKDYNLDYSINEMFLSSLPRFLHGTKQNLTPNRARSQPQEDKQNSRRLYPSEQTKRLKSSDKSNDKSEDMNRMSHSKQNGKVHETANSRMHTSKYNPEPASQFDDDLPGLQKTPGLGMPMLENLENSVASRKSHSPAPDQTRRNLKRGSVKFDHPLGSIKHIKDGSSSQSKPTSGPIPPPGVLGKPGHSTFKQGMPSQRRTSTSLQGKEPLFQQTSLLSKQELPNIPSHLYQDLSSIGAAKRSYLYLPDEDAAVSAGKDAPIQSHQSSSRVIGSRRFVPSQHLSVGEVDGVSDTVNKKQNSDLRNKSQHSDGQDPSLKRIPSREVQEGNLYSSGRNLTDVEFADNTKPVRQGTRTFKDIASKVGGNPPKKGGRHFKDLIVECMEVNPQTLEGVMEKPGQTLNVAIPDISKLTASEALKLLVQVNNRITEKYGDGQTTYTRYTTRGFISDGSDTVPASQSNFNQMQAGFPSPAPYEDRNRLDDIEEMEPQHDGIFLGRDDGSVRSHTSRGHLPQTSNLELIEEKEMSLKGDRNRKYSNNKEGSRHQGTPDQSQHRPPSSRRPGKTIQTMHHHANRQEVSDSLHQMQGHPKTQNEVHFRIRATNDLKIKIDKSKDEPRFQKSQDDLSFEQHHQDTSNLINESFGMSSINPDPNKSMLEKSNLMSISPGGNLLVQPLKNSVSSKRAKFKNTKESKASYYSSVRDPKQMKSYLKDLAGGPITRSPG